MVADGKGLFLLGAHLGSFEVIRALGWKDTDLRIAMVMREENAQKINATLAAINPEATQHIIGLGHVDSMLRCATTSMKGGSSACSPIALRATILCTLCSSWARTRTCPSDRSGWRHSCGDRFLFHDRSVFGWQPLRNPFRSPRRFFLPSLQINVPAPLQRPSPGMPGCWITIAARLRTTGSIFMISGKRPRFNCRQIMMTPSCFLVFSLRARWAVPAALALMAAPPVSSDDAGWGIPQLMQAMQQVQSGHARFTERKTIAMLDEPVDSSGELFYYRT